MPEEILSQKWDPTHSIMTCHQFLGSLWFCLTSHQLPSEQPVQLSGDLITALAKSPSPDHPQQSALVSEKTSYSSFYSIFSRVCDHNVLSGRNGAFLSWDLQSIAVNNKVFLVGWLTSANISVIRGETLPDLTMRSWYDMCQPVVLVISFSVARLDSAEPFM